MVHLEPHSVLLNWLAVDDLGIAQFTHRRTPSTRNCSKVLTVDPECPPCVCFREMGKETRGGRERS